MTIGDSSPNQRSGPGSRVALVMLAAGAGTRMKSALPKPLHRIAGVSMLDRVLAAGSAVCPAQTVVVVSPGLESMTDAIRHKTVVQESPRGTGDALRVAMSEVDDVDWVLVLFADHPLLTREIVADLLAGAISTGALVTVLTCLLPDAAEYGRIERDSEHRPVRIVEKANDERSTRIGAVEVNSGMMALNAEWLTGAIDLLKPNPPKDEYYLTDLVELAVARHAGADCWPVATVRADPDVMKGINDRVQLAEAESVIRERIRHRHMIAGVSFVSPSTSIVDENVTIGMDTIVEPFAVLRGSTIIGSGCRIGPHAVLTDATIGDRVVIQASTIVESSVASDSDVGPYSHLRGGTIVEREVHVGNYAEIKNSRIEPGARIGHFSYIGDSEVGPGANIGAGTVTANYDGRAKHRTIIGADAFIGSGSMLVAPVVIGRGAVIGAGSVVTRDVAEETKVMGVPARPMGRVVATETTTFETDFSAKDGD